uniref:C-type lectin domain-containing protein n=1 Tax=Panagrolaimus davidi TaxID=227884 RepID=A0A914PR04_9BILA
MLFIISLSLAFYIGNVKTECLNGTNPTFTNPSWCYFLQANPNYYLEAEQECRNHKGHLTSIHDIFDNMFLTQQALLTNLTDFWIGLNDLASSGKWSWMDNSTLDFTDWDKGQPENISGFDCCAVGMDHGKWISDDCFKRKPFVCLIKAPSQPSTTFHPTTTTTEKATTLKLKTCPYSYTYYNKTGFCYSVHGNETWVNAEDRCKIDGGYLASIHSPDEAHFVAKLAFPDDNVPWIGLYTEDKNAHWKWTDRTPVDYVNWASGQPDNPGVENCGVLWSPGNFNNLDCKFMTKFVCKVLRS